MRSISKLMRSGLGLLLVLCLMLSAPVTVLALPASAGEAVADAVDYCHKAQQIVDLIVDIADMEAIVGNVDRIYGDSREATSVLVAETYFEDPGLVLVAYSRNFPDGLCGGPLAYALGAPILLTNAGQEAVAAEYVAENGITKGLILGGTAAISEATVDAVFGLDK